MRAKKVYVSLSFGSICCLIVPVALADVAAVSLDWAQLQTNVFASKGQPVPTLSFSTPPSTKQTSTAASFADSDVTETRNTPNWTAAGGTNADTSHAQATTFASDGLVAVNAISFESSTGGDTFGTNTASGTVNRGESLTVDGAGAVFFSVPFQLSLEQGQFFSSMAQVSGVADFTSSDFRGSAHGEQTFTLDSFSGGPSSGLLTFGVVASGPGTITLDFEALASVTSPALPGMGVTLAVPEPSSFIALCAGLFAIGALAKRRLVSR